MAKYLVETYYTCTFKVNHYLDDINETEEMDMTKEEYVAFRNLPLDDYSAESIPTEEVAQREMEAEQQGWYDVPVDADEVKDLGVDSGTITPEQSFAADQDNAEKGQTAANPIPIDPPLPKIAVFIPIRLPEEFSSAPPLLPGFIAASV